MYGARQRARTRAERAAPRALHAELVCGRAQCSPPARAKHAAPRALHAEPVCGRA